MTPRMTTRQKLAEWKEAFDVILPELTDPTTKQMYEALGEIQGATQLQSSMLLSRIITANARAAALVAAMLVAQGVKPMNVDLGDDPEDV